MTHQELTDILGHAGGFTERVDGLRIAIRMGISLNEIEEHLDWLDLVQSVKRAMDDWLARGA